MKRVFFHAQTGKNVYNPRPDPIGLACRHVTALKPIGVMIPIKGFFHEAHSFIAGFWGNAQLAGNASGIIYIVDL